VQDAVEVVLDALEVDVTVDVALLELVVLVELVLG